MHLCINAHQVPSWWPWWLPALHSACCEPEHTNTQVQVVTFTLQPLIIWQENITSVLCLSCVFLCVSTELYLHVCCPDQWSAKNSPHCGLKDTQTHEQENKLAHTYRRAHTHTHIRNVFTHTPKHAQGDLSKCDSRVVTLLFAYSH